MKKLPEMILREDEYWDYLDEIIKLWNTDLIPNTPEWTYFDKLGTLIDEYEREHFPME